MYPSEDGCQDTWFTRRRINGGNGWDKGLYLALAGETVAIFGRGASGPKGFLK
jgi:hypothetical protein